MFGRAGRGLASPLSVRSELMATATAIDTDPSVPGILAGAPRAVRDGVSEGNGAQTLNEAELHAWRGLKRAHASLAKRVDAELERTHGLPLSTYEVLHRLAEAPVGRMRMCDLAEHAQLSRSGLTRLADRLEKEGLLERCSCEHDARGAYACLTDLGRERLS